MHRELKITNDGSHTLFVPDMNEPFHSLHGAIRESRHVFIEQGLKMTVRPNIRILEIGLGTGLNLLLTALEVSGSDVQVDYHAVEKYPLTEPEWQSLNYGDILPGQPKELFRRIHLAPWGTASTLQEGFKMRKEKSDFLTMRPDPYFDLVYFDAFAPDKQPELWSSDLFVAIAGMMHPGGILVSYTAKGSVRRELATCGFRVDKVPGPPGKREMIRATKS